MSCGEKCQFPLKCLQAERCMKDYMQQPDTPPTNAQELALRTVRNYETTGFGFDGVMVHLPCPFCGAKDGLVHKLLDTHAAYAAGSTCKECGRGWKGIISKNTEKCEHGTVLSEMTYLELVQTSGPDREPWMPNMRRQALN